MKIFTKRRTIKQFRKYTILAIFIIKLLLAIFARFEIIKRRKKYIGITIGVVLLVLNKRILRTHCFGRLMSAFFFGT